MIKDLRELLVRPGDSIRDAMRCIDSSRHGIALLVDDEGGFLATITDGDLRRAILGGSKLSSLAVSTVSDQAGHLRKSVTAREDTSREERMRIMRDAGVRQLPLLNEDRRVVALALSDDVEPSSGMPLH